LRAPIQLEKAFQLSLPERIKAGQWPPPLVKAPFGGILNSTPKGGIDMTKRTTATAAKVVSKATAVLNDKRSSANAKEAATLLLASKKSK
jgi:hypothetical protein